MFAILGIIYDLEDIYEIKIFMSQDLKTFLR